VLLARQEIELRREIYESKRDAELYRELQMLARMKAHYPHIPAELAAEFTRRLSAGAFASDAWDEAVEWLEGTRWFKQRS
jgi:hypothetical protein